MLVVNVMRTGSGHDLPLPEYQSTEASGLDLYCAESCVTIMFGVYTTIKTGIKLEIPCGYEGQVRPRSSMTKRNFVTPIGTIDSDYRGEIMVLLTHIDANSGPKHILYGDRIAQLVIAPVTRAKLNLVTTFSRTERGDSGFGSTDFKKLETLLVGHNLPDIDVDEFKFR